jgi:hypothetical protein
LFKRKSISGCHGEHSYTETQQYWTNKLSCRNFLHS